jgi:hypothetical protein
MPGDSARSAHGITHPIVVGDVHRIVQSQNTSLGSGTGGGLSLSSEASIDAGGTEEVDQRTVETRSRGRVIGKASIVAAGTRGVTVHATRRSRVLTRRTDRHRLSHSDITTLSEDIEFNLTTTRRT